MAEPAKSATHGGRRRGAGRPKTGKKLGGPHRVRPALSNRHAVHITLRVVRDLQNLRQRRVYVCVRRVLAHYLEGDEFRIVHISIQRNHVHLLVEAAGKRALQLGMQSFTINLARAINAALRRRGKVFAYRYHASQIKTAFYARNALSYVLNNWRHHREDMRGAGRSAKLDEYSSAVSFVGWTVRFARPPVEYEPLPVSQPRTSLLRDDWMLFGLIRHDECPGPMA